MFLIFPFQIFLEALLVLKGFWNIDFQQPLVPSGLFV